MDDMKLEDLEKAYKKIHKVRTRMVAVRMVRVRNMSVEETASITVRCPTWIHHRLRRYDEGGVRKYLEEHDGLEILYLPTATPKLSAVESVWKDAKYGLVTSEHYETLEDLTHAVSEYFRTCSIRLDIYKFLYRCL